MKQIQEPGNISMKIESLEKECKWRAVTHSQNLSGDVCNPVFFQTVAFGVLNKVCYRASTTKLHDQLHRQENQRGKNNIKKAFKMLKY